MKKQFKLLEEGTSRVELMNGNNIELLKKLPDNSIDSIVSDHK